MARRGDGIYLRGRTWRLDFTHCAPAIYYRERSSAS